MMAFDPIRQRTVLFGGVEVFGGFPGTVLADTWEFDGATWRPIATPNVPPARYDAAMAWDSNQRRIVLYGGRPSLSVALNDTWTYDGSDWAPLPTANTPTGGYLPPEFRSTLADDVANGALLSVANTEMTWSLGSFTRAAISHLGSGCGASGPPPVLRASEPRLGNEGFQFELSSVPTGSSCALVVADTARPVPVGGGCTVHVGGASFALTRVANAFGGANVPLPIPRDVSLRGLSLHAQAATLDPSTPLGLALSSAITLTLGDE